VRAATVLANIPPARVWVYRQIWSFAAPLCCSKSRRIRVHAAPHAAR